MGFCPPPVARRALWTSALLGIFPSSFRLSPFEDYRSISVASPISEADKCFLSQCVLKPAASIIPRLCKGPRPLHRSGCDGLHLRRPADVWSRCAVAPVPVGPDGWPIHTSRQQLPLIAEGYINSSKLEGFNLSWTLKEDAEDHVCGSWEYARWGSESLPDVSRGAPAVEQRGIVR